MHPSTAIRSLQASIAAAAREARFWDHRDLPDIGDHFRTLIAALELKVAAIRAA